MKQIPSKDLVENTDSSYGVLVEVDGDDVHGIKLHNLAFPHCITGDVPISSVLQNKAIEKYFLAANMTLTPDFEGRRAQGIYEHGKAKAELVKRNGKLKLSIDCDDFASLEDMESLRKLIYSNEIKPVTPYKTACLAAIRLRFR